MCSYFLHLPDVLWTKHDTGHDSQWDDSAIPPVGGKARCWAGSPLQHRLALHKDGW